MPRVLPGGWDRRRLFQPSHLSTFHAASPTTSATRFTSEEAIFSCGGLTPHIVLMTGTKTKLSIRQISILTALDRDTVTRRLQGLHSDPGTKNARMYEAPAALRAVLAPALAPEGTLEQIKVRNETLNARLKEVDLAKKTKDLVPDRAKAYPIRKRNREASSRFAPHFFQIRAPGSFSAGIFVGCRRVL
jgi:hypothetical protein